MIPSLCLVSVALSLAQPNAAEWQLTPQLSAGLELVYQGSYLEETLTPNVQHQRHYRLETDVLVLEASPKEWRGAPMTPLSLPDPRPPPDPQAGGPHSGPPGPGPPPPTRRY